LTTSLLDAHWTFSWKAGTAGHDDDIQLLELQFAGCVHRQRRFLSIGAIDMLCILAAAHPCLFVCVRRGHDTASFWLVD
jgi:uncharacterized membrane protein YhaH (DUF805 family)